MDLKNNGGAAFPQHGWSRDPEANKYMQDKGGMTLRDYFAGKALPGLLSTCEREPGGATSSLNAADIARSCYELADAMLAERAQ